MKIEKAKDKARWARILLHGASGSGKTYATGTLWRDGYKVLHLVVNPAQLDTLDAMGIDYDYVKVTKWAELFDIYLELMKMHQEVGSPAATSSRYDVVGIDPISDLQFMGKDAVLKIEKEADRRAALSGEKVMRIDDWGAISDMVRRLIHLFTAPSFPYHLVVTCESKPDDYLLDGSTRDVPALEGRMAQLIPAAFSYVGYTHIESLGGKSYYCLTSGAQARVITKDRTPLSGRTLINPKLKDIILAITEGKVPEETEIEKQLSRSLLVIRPVAPARVEKKK